MLSFLILNHISSNSVLHSFNPILLYSTASPASFSRLCRFSLTRSATCRRSTTGVQRRMAKGLIWATTEDLMRNKGRVLSLYRQLLRSLNSPDLPLNFAARMARKAEVRAIFMLGSEEKSLANIADLIEAGEYSLSLLKKGEIPKHIQ